MSSATKIMSMDSDSIKKYLFNMAMKSQWEEVVQAYRENKLALRARITKSGDTALHIAVSDGQEEHVEELVKLVSKKELEIQNERGNTPLHFAAAQGNWRMCECIAKDHPSLVGILNNDKETPLFLAALHGKKDAFLCLHYICTPGMSQPNYSYCRREDGETILHCTIAGEYYDLAFQIIALYRDLVNSVNEVGFSPLHLLASQPSAFGSGSHLSLSNRIIYNCILVDELKEEEANHFRERVINTINSERAGYPENYKTCFNFLLVFWKMAQVFVTRKEVDQTNIQVGKGSTVPQNREPKGGNPGHYNASFDYVDPENPEPEGGNPGHYNACFDYVDPENPEPQGGNPGHYNACFDYVKLLSKAMLIVLGLGGSTQIRKIRNKKEKHKWAVQIMDKLLESASMYEYEDSGGMNPQAATTDETRPYKISYGGHHITLGDIIVPEGVIGEGNYFRSIEVPKGVIGEGSLPPEMTQNKTPEMEKTETPILIASKNGVIEMVEKILELFPTAIHDVDSKDKNIVLLAVENKQTNVYQLLLNSGHLMKDREFGKVDIDWNSALHLAARLGNNKPWLIVGPALQMQWEVKWFEYVKTSMAAHSFFRYNRDNKTAEDIFTESHSKLVQEGVEWLSKTSESCSLIASLVATVSFATATTIPGGIKEESGRPILGNQPPFEVFAISSLVALCFSATSMFIFLSILLSRYQQKDFALEVPWKLLLGLTSLFVSMVSMMVSFCAGHFFMLKDKLGQAALPVYVMTCFPVAYFVVTQFPLYIHLIRANYSKVPLQSTATDPL